MNIVYELLKRRFIFEHHENKDEVLNNYCGMPLFFNKREFVIITRLKCHSPSKPIPIFTDTSKKHKESLCLLWFVHNVLMSKDVNNNIPHKWVKLSEDIKAFNNYPWDYDSYKLTGKYLLASLSPKINNLFGFPWNFMISSPRILRWLTAKNVKNPSDLFNHPYDAVMCYITNLKLSYVLYVATDESSVAAEAPYVANDASSVATFDLSLTICDSNVAIDDPYIAIDDASVATCDTNIAHITHM
ncbi:hypothetical protein H5410_056996 [Solanum commersonii]|uniref:DUF1985 domain-containing protein n=1 Tax=Solanum commersonii TaxID=4109 RepID=A0A9J5WPM5_SOLCO|nr:hypothetical protein H5410_056996 [Solanum commersonii]